MKFSTDYIKETIKALAAFASEPGITSVTGWYQEIDLQGVKTAKNRLSNIDTWNRIRPLMPDNLNGLRVLDIGCNAGLFCIMPALEGAVVTGLDDKQCWLDQAKFVKEVFEDQCQRSLPVTYIKSDVGITRLKDLPSHFDYALVIGVAAELKLAHGERKFSAASMKAQENLISDLTHISSNVIIRSRDKQQGMSAALYDSLFSSLRWHCESRIPDLSQDITLSLYKND